MPSKTEFQEKLDSSWEEVGTTVGLVGDNLWVSVAGFCLVHILGLPTNNPKSILCGYVCYMCPLNTSRRLILGISDAGGTKPASPH